MADWSNPTLSSTKVNVLAELKARDTDAASMAESPTNPPTGFKRWVSASNKIQTWNGSAWVDNVLGIASGGTGGSTSVTARAALGIGSLGVQNTDNINVSGGTISGLDTLGVLGNTTIGGILTVGSAPTQVTNAAGQVREQAIEDSNILARVGGTENITGQWTFGQNTSGYQIHINGALNQNRGLAFYNAGVYDGQILTINSALYYDQNTHYFRNLAGTIFTTINSDGTSMGNLLRQTGTSPLHMFTQTDAGADSKVWRWVVEGADFILQTLNDAETVVGRNAIQATRTGNEVSNVRLGAGVSYVSLTGEATISDGVLEIGQVIGIRPDVDSWTDIGSSSKRFNTVFASLGVVTTSDERHKNWHGDIINPLEILRSVEVGLASWKHDKDGMLFPAFSAQNLHREVDGKLGTQVVNNDRLDAWGVYDSRMVPLLWQIVKELDAEVQELKCNI